ncbi:predicted protein [Coccidioides posadasii str. Silveira]|uniref:Predicted protein n=1 Tax=Coccidioides posadasii (strain RMSCC 757 / Silveira) TaxID=443226 RepID=E9CR32_COCPS|nr:predicted protein [Coccidioides posadasii str. Silveira]
MGDEELTRQAGTKSLLKRHSVQRIRSFRSSSPWLSWSNAQADWHELWCFGSGIAAHMAQGGYVIPNSGNMAPIATHHGCSAGYGLWGSRAEAQHPALLGNKENV